MGRRRGRTGPGGAVVSSLSQNAGGTVQPRGNNASQQTRSSNRKTKEDEELNQLANLPSRAQNSRSHGAPSPDGASASSSSSSWLGKSPQQMLREWCFSNSRKFPSYVPCFHNHLVASFAISRCIEH